MRNNNRAAHAVRSSNEKVLHVCMCMCTYTCTRRVCYVFVCVRVYRSSTRVRTHAHLYLSTLCVRPSTQWHRRDLELLSPNASHTYTSKHTRVHNLRISRLGGGRTYVFDGLPLTTPVLQNNTHIQAMERIVAYPLLWVVFVNLSAQTNARCRCAQTVEKSVC